ncbi:MAG: cyclodeaminase/cyclohydrolase family protein [Deltaproteobacteria bacterium]|nr:MAG: cyclodeaminase/cyclohydrolase family protein [Deltaproteobacteria bacterium]
MGESFLAALARLAPVPGGGAAAAYGASVGVALLEKIVRLELKREGLTADLQQLWQSSLAQVSTLTRTFNRLRDQDGRAYLGFAQAKNSGLGEEAITAALEQAIECPVQIMQTAHDALTCVSNAAKHCKPHLLSDLSVVSELLKAAANGTYEIAQANLRVMVNASRKSECEKMLERLRRQCHETFRMVQELIHSRFGYEVGGS